MAWNNFKPPLGSQLNRGHPLSQGLVGCWLLNEGGGLTAYDISGRDNAGTLTNGPTWTSGKFGQALNFDGVNDYLNLGTSNTYNITSNLTVAFWIKPTIANQTSKGIVSRQTGGDLGWTVAFSNLGGIISFPAYVFSNSALSDAPLPINTWTHVVAISKPGPVDEMYINGVLQNQKGTDPLDSASGETLVFGRLYGGFDQQYSAMEIDDVRIYNRALTAAEVTWLYAEPFADIQPIKSPISYFWPPSAGGGFTAIRRRTLGARVGSRSS